MLTLNFESFPELHTTRLILRETKITDAQALFALRKDEQVMKYIHRKRPQNVADIEQLIQNTQEGYLQGQSLVWAIALKENPELMIGTMGYYRTELENYRAEIGYMLSKSYWRQGIIAEALVRTVEFGFKNIGLHSITANIDPGNEASRKILEKHNFIREAHFRENFYFNGKFLDSEIYTLLSTESAP